MDQNSGSAAKAELDVAMVEPVEAIFRAVTKPAADRDERRIAARRLVTIPGAITFDEGQVKHYCIIRDVSDTGAKINLSKDLKIPTEFDLWLVQKNLSRRVCLKWRKGDLAGVAFK